jgi:uncharacterized protein
MASLPIPANGKEYCAMTHNSHRTHQRVAHVRRRGPGHFGQIIECPEDNADGTAETFTWALFLFCGDPSNRADSDYFAGLNPQLVSPVSSPRHIAFDICDNLWSAAADQASTSRTNDSLYAVPVVGPERGCLRQFLSSVPGSTIASLTFTLNNHTLFCSVQHPGDGSGLDDPSSAWPDRAIPPSTGVIAVEKTEGSRVIGS